MRSMKGFMLSIVIMCFTAFTLQAMEPEHVKQESSYQVPLGSEAEVEVLKNSLESIFSVEVKQEVARISDLSILDAGIASNVELVGIQEVENISVENELLADRRVLKPPVNI